MLLIEAAHLVDVQTESEGGTDRRDLSPLIVYV
jgi:hypothetical protein